MYIVITYYTVFLTLDAVACLTNALSNALLAAKICALHWCVLCTLHLVDACAIYGYATGVSCIRGTCSAKSDACAHEPRWQTNRFNYEWNIFFHFFVMFALFWNHRKTVKRAAGPCTLHRCVLCTLWLGRCNVRFMVMPLGCPILGAHVWQTGCQCAWTQMKKQYFLQ